MTSGSSGQDGGTPDATCAPLRPAGRGDEGLVDLVDLGPLASDLRLACLRIARRIRFEPAAPGLAPHAFSVLARLGEGPATPGSLAAVERVSAPSMTRTVAGLVDAGLASRESCPTDGRAVLISLTPAGAEVLAATRARRDLWMSSRIAQLSPGEVDDLRRAATVLAKVAAL